MKGTRGGFSKDSTVPVTVENSPLVIVEYPMPIANTPDAIETACNMIGGCSELCKQTKASNGSLVLQLAENEPLCDLIRAPTSDRVECTSSNAKIIYALKIRRRKKLSKKDSNEEENWSVISSTLIGPVALKFQWNSLCEPVFQVCPTLCDPPLTALPDKFFPPSITKRRDYSFKQIHNEFRRAAPQIVHGYTPLIASDSNRCPPMSEQIKNAIHHTIRDFNSMAEEKNVKDSIMEVELKELQKDLQNKRQKRTQISLLDKTRSASVLRKGKVLFKLQELFEKVPMWLRTEIQKEFAMGFRFNAIEMLPLVAFTYIGGPFKNYWTRYGFNPFEHPLQRFIQSFGFRLPKSKIDHYFDMHGVEVEEKLKDIRDKHGKPLLLFGQPLSMQHHFYLIKMDDRKIQEFLLAAPRLDKPNSSTGWFSHETLRKVRLLVYQRCQQIFGTVGGGAKYLYSAGTPLTKDEFWERAKKSFYENKEIVVPNSPLTKPSTKTQQVRDGVENSKERKTSEEVDSESEGENFSRSSYTFSSDEDDIIAETSELAESKNLEDFIESKVNIKKRKSANV
mmetsp:Transcript_2467/g.3610  ORF Transcript_2467/g.3610 Transcript_2467/m.3610 type:complete len:564 (-) Transcript_2467:118-1809(-)